MPKILGILMTAFLITGCTTDIAIRTQIDIDAPPNVVWQTLADFERYPDWNPYHIRVVGELAEGAPLEVRVRRPDGKIVDVPAVHILRLEPERELTWGGGIEGIFHGAHVFLLEQLPGGGTRLIHNEDFEGLFIGFADLPPDVLTEGYNLMNKALKTQVESAAGS